MAERTGEYEQAGTDMKSAKRGQAVIDYVLGGMSLVTGGASELVAPAIRRLMQKRVDDLRDTLIRDLKAGVIDPDAVIQEDDLVH